MRELFDNDFVLPTSWLTSVNINRQFGKPGSPYDFSKVDVNRLKDKARDLEAQQKGMKKKVNPKVINMIDRYVVNFIV